MTCEDIFNNLEGVMEECLDTWIDFKLLVDITGHITPDLYMCMSNI